MKIENVTYRKMSKDDRIDVADLYCEVFATPPWNENFWTRELALEVIDGAIGKNDFIGAVAEKENKIIGFTFGYPLSLREDPGIDAVRENLTKIGIDVGNVFYGAEAGVEPELRNLGIGTNVFDYRRRLVRNKGFSGVASRTKNPAMIRVYEKVFGADQVQAVFQDPVNIDRTWYYVHLKESNKKKQEVKKI